MTAGTLAEILAGPPAARVLLCPEGLRFSDDAAFLLAASLRLLWPPPEADLAAAVAGLRGEHVDPPQIPAVSAPARGRKSALLMEGIVNAARAARAAGSPGRDWIVETPFHVRLSRRLLAELSAAGVRWFALRPVRLEAVLLPPESGSRSAAWREALPAGARLAVLPGRRAART